jgi:CRP-like cAMP-binding protein
MLTLTEISAPRSFPQKANRSSSEGPMHEILSRQPLRRLSPHEHLFHEGDREGNIYRIERGLVRLYKLLNDGRCRRGVGRN